MSGVAITFPPGSTDTTYTITLRPDIKFEGGDELLIIGLRATGAGGVVISQGQFMLTITEDDSRSYDITTIILHCFLSRSKLYSLIIVAQYSMFRRSAC